MVGHAVEVAKTVVEVADVAFTAVECCHKHRHHHHQNHPETTPHPPPSTESDLRLENQRLRSLLQQNLNLLKDISLSPALLPNCPPDLHERLLDTVASKSFLNQLESLSLDDGNSCKFPFREPSGADFEAAEIVINVGHEQPSWWVWVTDEMVPSNIEEVSGIDDENYVVISEDHVVEGVVNFMAKFIVSCPKAKDMSPEELQKSLSKALGGMNKMDKMLSIWQAGQMFYTLSTWGIALAGLWKGRAVLRVAAMGINATSKLVLTAI